MGVPKATTAAAGRPGAAVKKDSSKVGAVGRLLLALLAAALILAVTWTVSGRTLPYVQGHVDRLADRYLDFDGDGVGGGRGMCKDVHYPDGTVARCS